MHSIDLNADVGEGAANDAALMDFVSSINIACGGHAGNEQSMRECMQTAKLKNVAIGAHPSFADPEHFGRRQLQLPQTEIFQSVVAQLEAIHRAAKLENALITHIKPHGALYHQTASCTETAKTFISACNAVLPGKIVVGLYGGALIQVAGDMGAKHWIEAFIDRRYQDDGNLLARSEPGAVFVDPQQACEQALCLATQRPVVTNSGGKLQLQADTLCLHGDNEAALATAKEVALRFAENRIVVRHNAQ